MKNIYDIFEQRKIDSINCDYRNILETYEEIDILCNTLDNEYYDCIEEAFDFKKMKDSIKSGAKTAGKAIGNMINKAVEFLKELWKKIKTWFTNIKNHLFKKNDIEDIVDKKLEAALVDNDSEHESNEDKKPERTSYKSDNSDIDTKKLYSNDNDDRKTEYENIKKKRKKLEYDLYHGSVGKTEAEVNKMEDDIRFLKNREKEYLNDKRLENKHRDKNWNDKKKDKSDAQTEYKNKQRNERKFDKNRKPSIQEILHHMANMSFKSTPIVDCNTIIDELIVVREVMEILEDLPADEATADYTIMTDLKKQGIIKNELEDIVNNIASKTPIQLTLGKCSTEILSYVNSQDKMKIRITKAEAKIDKVLGKKIRDAEKMASDPKFEHSSEFIGNYLRINREGVSICTKIIQMLSGLYNNEHNKVSSIVSQATDRYIKEVLKR